MEKKEVNLLEDLFKKCGYDYNPELALAYNRIIQNYNQREEKTDMNLDTVLTNTSLPSYMKTFFEKNADSRFVQGDTYIDEDVTLGVVVEKIKPLEDANKEALLCPHLIIADSRLKGMVKFDESSYQTANPVNINITDGKIRKSS